MKKTAESVDKY